MHRFKLEPNSPRSGRTDWARVDALTDDQAEAAALDDPDAQPTPDHILRRMRPAPNVKAIRAELSMTTEEFATAFGLSEARVRGWESGDVPILPSERTLLHAIDASPETMRFVTLQVVRGERAKRARKSAYHVIKSSGRWEVRKLAASRSTSVHDTQQDAIQAARDLAKHQNIDVIVHRPDGQIRRRYGYSRIQSRMSA